MTNMLRVSWTETKLLGQCKYVGSPVVTTSVIPNYLFSSHILDSFSSSESVKLHISKLVLIFTMTSNNKLHLSVMWSH